jgi:TonB-linked SusC/RagA family outer membrane protein
MSRNVFIGIVIQQTLLCSLIAADLSAQYKNQSIKDIFLTIDVDDASLATVFKTIEGKTGFSFVYNAKVVDLKRKMTMHEKDASLMEILLMVSRESDLKFQRMNEYIHVGVRENSQDTEVEEKMLDEGMPITGRVTSAEDGEGLPGVNVIVQGTAQGTVTDVEGRYNIEVPDENTVLVFSSVGFVSEEVIVGSRTQINISLSPDITALEEIVVVGFGTMKKSDLTGTVVSAPIEDFRQAPNVSIMQSLQGTVPGLNVGQVNSSGQEPDISIRGRTTISGTQQPLIVVDNVIYRGAIIDINPNDIESIDVLKDASAAAIFGSQAANGVILITTKSGKQVAAGRPEISYTGQFSMNSPANVVTPINREEALDRTYDADWTNSRLAPDYLEPNPDWNIYDTFKNIQQTEGYDNGTDTDWLDLLTQDSWMQNHNVGVQGGSKNFNYYTAFGYTDQRGWIINDDYKRYNIRLNFENRFTDWLTLGTQSFFTLSDYSGVSPDPTGIYEHPFYAAFDAEGEPLLQPTGLGLNPILEPTLDDLDKRINGFANLYANVSIPFVPGLSYRLNYNNNYRHNRNYRFNPYGNLFQGEGYKNNRMFYDWTLDHWLTYEKDFADHHEVKATLVYGREKRTSEFTDTYSSGFINDVLGYNSLQAGDILQQTVNTGAWEENSLYFMGRLFYSFKNRYMVTGTVRRDGFSGFGEDNKVGVFPSVAVAWALSEEPFMQNIDWMDYLKFRASYGTNGNRTIDRYATQARVSQQFSYVYGDGGNPELGQWISQLPNSELGWETTTGINLGLDFTLINGRLFGNFEYYNNRTNDLLFDIQIPGMTGFNSIATNIGELQNHGYEASITTVNIDRSDWNWQTTLNFSLNRNEVVSILGYDNDGDGVEDDLVASGIFIGQPLGVIFSYEIAGMWQLDDEIPAGFYPGTYRLTDIDGDGVISPENDRKILGFTDPGYRLSLQSKLSYKNWSFNFFINSIQGGRNFYYGDAVLGKGWDSEDASHFQGGSTTWDYWTPENPNARYPQLQLEAAQEPALPIQRNFVRLQDVSLAYGFETGFGIRGRVYMSGKNLITITDWEGWDPETGEGIIKTGFPVMRSYALGIDLSF